MNLRYLPCEKATQDLLASMIERGYLMDDLVSVTVQGDGEQELAAGLKNTVDAVLSDHRATASVEVSVVSPEVKAEAYNHHLSPAKYMAIQALQVNDPSITFEGCAGHSLGELRDRAGHGVGYHGQIEDEGADDLPPQAGIHRP